MSGEFWVGLAFGLFIGAPLGALIMAALVVASDADDKSGQP